jgi:hypothetical protein
MFASFRNKNLESVTIVDPNPDILKKWRDLLRRRSVNSKAKWS